MREFGAAFKVLDGDDALPYLGYARTELGILKNSMRLGGLAQGSRTRVLPDGTVLRVQSQFGIDKIVITTTAPTPAAPEPFVLPGVPAPQEPQPSGVELPFNDVTISSLLVAGVAVLDGNTFHNRGFLWTKARGSVLLPMRPTDVGSAVYAVSSDGHYIVGSVHDAVGYYAAAVWRRDGTLNVIADSAWTSLQATGVSEDGKTICGIGTHGGVSCYWWWTAKAGVQLLPGSYATDGRPACISRDGKIVAALAAWVQTIYTWIAPSYPSHPVPWINITTRASGQGAVWTLGAGPDQLPADGLQYTTHSKDSTNPNVNSQPDQIYSYPSDFQLLPYGVADTGVVVGSRQDADGFVWSPLTGYAWITPPNISSRDPKTDGSIACAVTPKGTAVTGYYTAAADGAPTVWLWARDGIRALAPGAGYAISDDGGFIAGGGGPDSVNYNFEPRVWHVGGKAIALPLPAGATSAWGTAVAAPTVSFSGG